MKKENRALNIVLWVLQLLGAAMFLMAGSSKLTGNQQMVQAFEMIGLGQWFRVLTGALEVIGAVLLLVPQTAFFGALLLAIVMVGAVIAHLFVLGGSPAMAVILLLAMAIIAWGRRGRISALYAGRDKEVTA
ncbi:MAG TPA: DoxX family protein [Candidatus Manganitrophaceae bacterium]|nr:DoxX family protein [Candidatus Manganitrophaceae bacterium]